MEPSLLQQVLHKQRDLFEFQLQSPLILQMLPNRWHENFFWVVSPEFGMQNFVRIKLQTMSSEIMEVLQQVLHKQRDLLEFRLQSPLILQMLPNRWYENFFWLISPEFGMQNFVRIKLQTMSSVIEPRKYKNGLSIEYVLNMKVFKHVSNYTDTPDAPLVIK